MKDEKKYSDLGPGDVLDTLETWSHDLFSEAGTAPSSVPVVFPQPMIERTSRPGQPASHVPPTLSDTDPVPAIPCFGDQLSRVRLAGGKDLRASAHTPRDRFEHLYPFRVAPWHTKRSFLKVSQTYFGGRTGITDSNNKKQIKGAVLYAVTKQLPGDVILYKCTFESVVTPWVLISCIQQRIRFNIKNQYGF